MTTRACFRLGSCNASNHPDVIPVWELQHPPEILALLSEPLRWQLVTELGRSDRRVGELVELVGEAAELGLLPSGGATTRRHRERAPELGGRPRRLLPGRSVSLPGSARGCRSFRSIPGSRSRRRDRLASSRGGDGRECCSCAPANSARSQIAEALVEHRSAGAVEARSAGSRPKPLQPERGASHDRARESTSPGTPRSRSLVSRAVGSTGSSHLCDKVREICPAFPGTPIAVHWSIADPATRGRYRRGDVSRVSAGRRRDRRSCGALAR